MARVLCLGVLQPPDAAAMGISHSSGAVIGQLLYGVYGVCRSNIERWFQPHPESRSKTPAHDTRPSFRAGHPADRLTSPDSAADQEQPGARGTPAHPRDSWAASHGQHLKTPFSRTPQATMPQSRNIEAKRADGVRTTPAMAAKVADHVWSLFEISSLLDPNSGSN